MKKIISLISGITLALGMGAVSASAQTPAINYNGEPQVVENIRNVDGRVQLPFRAVFEMMGATVDYEDATRKVTATRDDITVEFFADGSELTVTDETGTSVIPAEIGFDYERDRVMVPVRFVSNALGSRVGWDDATKTVFILDTYPLIQELKTNSPNIYKMFDVLSTVETNLSSDSNVNASFSFSSPELTQPTVFNIKATASQAIFNNTGKGNLTFDFTHQNLNNLADINLGQLTGVSFDIAKTDSAIYFNTNIGAKLTEFLPDVPELKQVQNFLGTNTWFRIDYNFIEKRFGKAVADSTFKGTPVSADDFLSILSTTSDVYTDVTEDEVIAIVAAFNFYEKMFSKMNITEISPGNCTITLTMTWDDILTLLAAESTDAPVPDFKLDLSVNIKDNVPVSNNVTFVFSSNDGITQSITMNATETAEKLTSAPEIKIPENSISLESVFTLLGW